VSHLALLVVLEQKMHYETLYAVAGAVLLVLAAIFVYHAFVARPALTRMQRLVALHDGFLSGDGESAAGRLQELERLNARVRELESRAATDLSRAGFVRYDAFEGNSSGLSYALALLNRQGDGVVITSIYSRDDSRTFGKPVEAFKPTVHASAEELEAIERARAFAPVEGAPR